MCSISIVFSLPDFVLDDLRRLHLDLGPLPPDRQGVEPVELLQQALLLGVARWATFLEKKY